MNTSELIHLERIFYPGWLMASQLRTGQEIHDGERFYRQARRLVERTRIALTDAGYSETQRESMVYALCALLDESVLNRGTSDDGYLVWHRDPLQAHFFSTLNAGEELWECIRTILKETAPDIAVLTCLYRTVQLGFVGQYRVQDDEHREDVVRTLSERVAPFRLTQDSPVITRVSGLHRGRCLYWLSWATGVGGLAALWFFLSASLTGMVNQIIGLG